MMQALPLTIIDSENGSQLTISRLGLDLFKKILEFTLHGAFRRQPILLNPTLKRQASKQLIYDFLYRRLCGNVHFHVLLVIRGSNPAVKNIMNQ